MKGSGLCAVLAGVVAIAGATVARAQCTKDTDCKGDRICQAGHCVSPSPGRPPTGPAPPPLPAAGVAAERLVVFDVDFRDSGLPDQWKSRLTQVLATALDETQRFETVRPHQVADDCSIRMSCHTQVAQALGAAKTLYVGIKREGVVCQTSAMLYDAVQRSRLRQEQAEGACLLEEVERTLAKLARMVAGEVSGCRSDQDCPPGHTCVDSRCVALGSPPAPTAAPRSGFIEMEPRTKRIHWLWITGLAGWFVTYVVTIGATAGVADDLGGTEEGTAEATGYSAIPLFGPFVVAGKYDIDAGYKVALVASGLIQAGAVAMFIAGLTIKRPVAAGAMYNAPARPRLAILPGGVGRDGWGMSVNLAF